MSGAREYLQVKFLKTLEPLSSLSVDKLEEISNKSQVEELPPGRVVFRQGEKDARSTYLLSGQLELQVTGNPRTEVIKAKTADARYPIAQEWPRPSTCRSKTNVVLLHIDSNLLEILLSDDPSGTYEVTEISGETDPETDWMLRFLQSPAFLQLPTENIQSILVRLEEIPVQAGQTIIRQGDTDDWYYIVKKGKCHVSRRPAPRADEVRLAMLGPGDGFGEEALITNGKRNATVTMKEAGILMRLSKTDFHELLIKPMLQEVDHPTMMAKVKSGAALIDVRNNKEFNDNGIKGAQNIPLSMLRIKAKDLNITREHIVYCNDATQSRAAAFLLAQQSIRVFILGGGLEQQSKPFSASPAPAVAESTPAAVTPSRPATTPAPVPPSPVTASSADLSIIQNKDFTAHKRAAEEKARKAEDAEQVVKSVAARTDHLREQADALRAQADRLAKKTANAEEEKRKAQAEIDQLKQEALQQRDELLNSAKQEIQREKELARQQEAEVSRLRQEAEEARLRAEQELQRIRQESVSINQQQNKLSNEVQRAEQERAEAERTAEIARIMAKQESDKLRQEAEAIKQNALKEAERLRSELETRRAKMAEEEAHHQKTAMDEARRRAELSVADASRAADEARRQAALEAEAIRKQAMKEAESLRIQLEKEKQQAAELLARNKAEEELRRQELEEVRNKTLNDARKQAELEAQAIRERAIQEAQIQAREEARRKAQAESAALKQQTEAELAEARRKAELETEALRKQAMEEFSRQAMQTAQMEAEEIRRAALEEASRLRAEMEQTRQLVEQEAARAKAQIEEESHRRQQEQAQRSAAELAAREALAAAERKLAEQEAEQQAAEQLAAQRLANAEREAREIAEQQARIAEQVRKQREIEQEQARLAEEIRASEQKQREEQARQAAEEERAAKARKMAESLRSKLDEQESSLRQDEFELNMGRGPKLAKAKLHVVKDKTILEGEEDIFIFKAPSERPPNRDEAEALLKQAENRLAEQSRNELPSFDLDYADEPEEKIVVEQESEFSESILMDLDNITASSSKPQSSQFDDDFTPENKSESEPRKTGRSRSSLIALAASVVVMVTISIVAITRPTYLEVDRLSDAGNDNAQPARGLAAMRSNSSNHRQIIEEQLKAEAEQEFNRRLSDLRNKQ